LRETCVRFVTQALAGTDKPARGQVLVVGAGKASGAMAAAVEEAWATRLPMVWWR